MSQWVENRPMHGLVDSGNRIFVLVMAEASLRTSPAGAH